MDAYRIAADNVIFSRPEILRAPEAGGIGSASLMRTVMFFSSMCELLICDAVSECDLENQWGPRPGERP